MQMVLFNYHRNIVGGEEQVDSHFTEEETKTQKSQVICPKSNSSKAVESEFGLKSQTLGSL